MLKCNCALPKNFMKCSIKFVLFIRIMLSLLAITKFENTKQNCFTRNVAVACCIDPNTPLLKSYGA